MGGLEIGGLEIRGLEGWRAGICGLSFVVVDFRFCLEEAA